MSAGNSKSFVFGALQSSAAVDGHPFAAPAAAPAASSTAAPAPWSFSEDIWDVQILMKVHEEPWYKLAQDEFDSIGEDFIETVDFCASINRMFEKKKVPILRFQTLEFMFRTFDTNGDGKLSKTEFLCGIWRTMAFADAAAFCEDKDDEDRGQEWEGDEDDEDRGGEWEGDCSICAWPWFPFLKIQC